jgi:hydrogenase maturation protease
MKKSVMPAEVLLIGIGNNSRGDDALGWLVADGIPETPEIHTEYRYQLQIEDADLIKDYTTVIFADATREALPEGFSFRPGSPEGNITFSSHRLSPSALLALCQEIYGCRPEAYELAIAGTHWELGMGLSPEASTHLDRANRSLKEWLIRVKAQKKALQTEGLPN